VHIRRATEADAASIARLTTELGYPTSPEEIHARLAELLARETQFIAVAEQPEGVAAWAAAEERVLLESGRRAELVGLVVTYQARRLGLGRRLVSEAEVWARNRGLPSISVRSNVLRAEAHPFYERLGYTRKKTQHAYFKQLAPG
jgi:GNAT superfamily N-acetyltransferase